jgi:serine/threonine protein kinase
MVIPLANATNSMVGAVLSRRWRLVRKLGEGGMGEVYAAEALDGGAHAAVKVLRREFVGDPDVRARFLEEARTCMRLVHPNIVRVIECARAEDEPPFIVMELLDGVPLGAYMKNGARIALAQAAPIVQAILAGLAVAHTRGIVHRDLKPDNVILTRDPRGAFVVKLVDFGIAKVMDAAGGMGSRTRTGVLLGTPAYMSPEQARSARDVDQRADLWSVGVLFYEMLSGRVAFPAPTEYARLAALLSTEPEPIDRIDPSLAQLVPFLECALRKSRHERFQSASEMSRALAAAMPASALRAEWGAAGAHPSGPPPDASATATLGARTALPEETARDAPAASVINRLRSPNSSIPPTINEKLDVRLLHPHGATGGTLASPQAGVVIDPVPQVLMVEAQPFGGTLPSKMQEVAETAPSGRASARAGVAPKVVMLFVACALALGLALGWLIGRI